MLKTEAIHTPGIYWFLNAQIKVEDISKIQTFRGGTPNMIFHIPAYENVCRPPPPPQKNQAVSRTRKFFPIIVNSRIKIPAIFRATSGNFRGISNALVFILLSVAEPWLNKDFRVWFSERWYCCVWEDNIKQGIWQLKNQNWVACVQDRGKRKEVVEKTKTFSAWKKKKNASTFCSSSLSMNEKSVNSFKTENLDYT